MLRKNAQCQAILIFDVSFSILTCCSHYHFPWPPKRSKPTSIVLALFKYLHHTHNFPLPFRQIAQISKILFMLLCLISKTSLLCSRLNLESKLRLVSSYKMKWRALLSQRVAFLSLSTKCSLDDGATTSITEVILQPIWSLQKNKISKNKSKF